MRFTEWNSKKSKEYRYFREKGQRYNDQQENDRHRQDQNDSTQDRHNRRQNENDLDMEDANPIMKNSPKKNQKWNQTKMNQTTPRVSTKTQHLIHPIAGKPRLPKTKNKLINLNVSIPNNPQTQLITKQEVKWKTISPISPAAKYPKIEKNSRRRNKSRQ